MDVASPDDRSQYSGVGQARLSSPPQHSYGGALTGPNELSGEAHVVVDSDSRVTGDEFKCRRLLYHDFKEAAMWETVIPSNSDHVPKSRFGHTAVVHDSRMIVFGGRGQSEYFNDCYAYDVDTRRWNELGEVSNEVTDQVPAEDAWSGSEEDGSVPCSRQRRLADTSRPCGRCGHSAVMYGNSMYVVSGGVSDHNECTEDMWAFSLDNNTWRKVGQRFPFAGRKGHTTHLLLAKHTAGRSTSDMLVTFGGLTSRTSEERRYFNRQPQEFLPSPVNEVLIYHFQWRQWNRLRTSGDVPCPRFYHVSQLIDDTSILIVFGGRTVAAFTDSQNIVSSSGEISASDGRTAPSTGESRSSAVLGSQTLGASLRSEVLNDLYLLDISTGMWRAVRDTYGPTPSRRMCSAGVYAQGKFAIFAGGCASFCAEGCEYDIVQRRWRRFYVKEEPLCSRPTVVYARGRLVFFGGCKAGNEVMNNTLELSMPWISLEKKGYLWFQRLALRAAMLAETRVRRACCARQRDTGEHSSQQSAEASHFFQLHAMDGTPSFMPTNMLLAPFGQPRAAPFLAPPTRAHREFAPDIAPSLPFPKSPHVNDLTENSLHNRTQICCQTSMCVMSSPRCYANLHDSFHLGACRSDCRFLSPDLYQVTCLPYLTAHGKNWQRDVSRLACNTVPLSMFTMEAQAALRSPDPQSSSSYSNGSGESCCFGKPGDRSCSLYSHSLHHQSSLAAGNACANYLTPQYVLPPIPSRGVLPRIGAPTVTNSFPNICTPACDGPHIFASSLLAAHNVITNAECEQVLERLRGATGPFLLRGLLRGWNVGEQ